MADLHRFRAWERLHLYVGVGAPSPGARLHCCSVRESGFIFVGRGSGFTWGAASLLFGAGERLHQFRVFERLR